MVEIFCLVLAACALYWLFRFESVKNKYITVCRERDRLKHKLQTGEDF